MSVNDRLYEELLKPVVEDYYNSAKTLGEFLSVPYFRSAENVKVTRLQERLVVLEETGDRIARVLELPEPLWEDMRGMAGVPDWMPA